MGEKGEDPYPQFPNGIALASVVQSGRADAAPESSRRRSRFLLLPGVLR